MSATVMKVTSLSSSSGAPSPPNASPATDASGAANVGDTLDLEAIGRVLEPIEEELNEQADAAMLPSPPSNTPAFSHAPSVYRPRSRGFSLIKDRLAQLKNQPRRDSDYHSNCSDGVSTKGSDTGSVDGDASSVGDRSTGNSSWLKHPLHKTATLIRSSPDSGPIILASAQLNPRVQEYIQSSGQDLPVFGTAKDSSSPSHGIPANDGSHVRGASFDTIATDNSGVTEKSTWVEDCEDAIERGLLRLEQLAYDSYTVDPAHSMEEYYAQTLQRVLLSDKRKFKVSLAPEHTASSLPSTVALTETSGKDVAESAPDAAEKAAN